MLYLEDAGRLSRLQLSAKRYIFSRSSYKEYRADNVLQVINGILFMHSELHLYHGSISCKSIMLSRDGKVKLGKSNKARN